MKEIQLSRGKVAIVDDSDFTYLSQFKWHCNSRGYACRAISLGNNKTKSILMHREIVKAKPGELYDHKNMNPLDNRRANIRLTDKSKNTMNTKVRSDNPTGYKGVSKSVSGRYRAYIHLDGKQTHLGTFDTPEEAAITYNKAALAVHGEFARLNNV